MLRPRIIPCLLVHNKGLVKTVRFSEPKYVGDPLNAVRIYNEKEVDELIVLDIDASVEGKEPNYDLIANLARECRMPLCYGGGIRTSEQVEKIVGLGVEKVAISSTAIRDPSVIENSAIRVGRQSVVVVVDVKRVGLLNKRYELFTHNGKVKTGKDAVEFSTLAASLGAGEIVINSIDRDGTFEGYDFDLVKLIRNAVRTPISVLGGAAGLRSISELIDQHGIIGAVAGSIFVFKGKYRAVLIQYPDKQEKKGLINGSL